MKIRRYLGNNTQEAILKVKMDLGNNAIILNTKKVRRKGLRNLFSKPMVEVLAAIDEYSAVSRVKTEEHNSENIQQAQQSKMTELQKGEKTEKFEKLESKVTDLEALLLKIYGKLENNNEGSDPFTALNPGMNYSLVKEKENSAEKILELFYNNLLKNEVEITLAKEIINEVKERLGNSSSVNEAVTCLYSIIKNMLGKPQALKVKESSDGPTVVIFLGPTGVGKTTTLAKIAANYTLNKNKSVALITADTYRIAAVEQLKTYAEILGLPISVVYSPDEINEIIKTYFDKDIILIDTAGRSHKNSSQFEELKTLVSHSNADEVFLVLSSTISIGNCKDLIDKYNFINNYKFIFTKTDETSAVGLILNLRHMTGKNLSYITTGQNVPDDIELANIDKITKSLIGSIN